MSRDDEETRAEDKDAYFVSYREVKVGKRVKVYLTKGGSDARRKQKPEEVLAAVGEDSGSKTGARFRNAANFTEHGHLDSDSRREVSEWLDGIVAEGLAREAAAGGGGGSDDSLHHRLWCCTHPTAWLHARNMQMRRRCDVRSRRGRTTRFTPRDGSSALRKSGPSRTQTRENAEYALRSKELARIIPGTPWTPWCGRPATYASGSRRRETPCGRRPRRGAA